MFHHREQHDPEVAKWCYRMMNDPSEWEKFRFKDSIDNYNMIIEECQKLYDNTPADRQRIFSYVLQAWLQ